MPENPETYQGELLNLWGAFALRPPSFTELHKKLDACPYVITQKDNGKCELTEKEVHVVHLFSPVSAEKHTK